MKDYLSLFVRYFMFMLAFCLQVDAEASWASEVPSVRLSGHVPNKALKNAVLLESLDAKTQVPVTFILPLRNKEVLEELVKSIYNPADQQHYGKYLSSEEFVELFAPTSEDYKKVIAYAKSLGLTVTGTHANRTLLNVVGTTNSIEKAFNLNLHQYQLPSGRKFHAPNNDPEVPVSIAAMIDGIVGLDNHAVWHPQNIKKQTSNEFLATKPGTNSFPSGPGGGYSPSDLWTAYELTEVSAEGTGQIIALFELAKYLASDINEYTNFFGLPTANLKNILVDGGATIGIDAEVTLDIELALALAPQSQIYVYEGPNTSQGVLDTYNRIATDNLAKQVSTSWGVGENFISSQYLQAENAIFLQMAAHGQTIYAAAGDSGAYDDYADNNSEALVVDDPASQPYVVGVGGTKLAVNSGSCTYESEVVWNEGLGNGAGGGGVSTVWPIPTWQANVSTVYSKTYRNVPDVSLNADPNSGYAIFYNGQWAIYGGTSCAAPLWSAFTARVNQELESTQKPFLGFANPALYAICSGSSYPANFHDITTGNNLYYSAKTGYDNATGWGSFNGVNLYETLTNSLPTPPPAQQPVLNITMKHSTPFTRDEIGTYTIIVSNQGNSSTSGTVTVGITLPNGFSYESLTGSGWTFNSSTLTCTQNNVLNPGSSYSTIVLKVNVSDDAANTVIPSATVSGGGSISSTTTNLTTVNG